MRLEQIVIHGFKSFAEKTEIRILPGISCIVGPNGCGKSNVADAVRWALGEQSPKSLRGHRMEDVIFHGSTSRRPLGLADVTLTFANDGRLGLPWAEVAVARRLYRTGDSEYLLNRQVCRLRDIQDLFAGTGVNPRAYALMDQERLTHVLTARPWERRIFIEEAAGIARYKQQRAETEGKLEATRQNLQHVRAVMEEVRRQLHSIERQARRAQQYKMLEAERQALARSLLAADYGALAARLDALQAEIADLGRQEEARRTRAGALAAREAAERTRIQEAEYRLGDLRQSAQKVQNEVERLLERRDQMGLQLRDLGEEAARLAAEQVHLEERRRSLQSESEAGRASLQDARERLEAEAGRLGALEAALEERRSQVRGRGDALEALRLSEAGAAGRRAELAREEAELAERRLWLGRRAERLAAETADTEAQARALGVERRRLEERRRQTGEQLSLLEAERAEVQAALDARRAEQARLQGEVSELRVRLAARRSALESLEQLERDREGYGAGVREVFAARAAGALPGVVGTVADLLEVPSGLETAVEGVLGDRLQWVVVERFEHARAALGHLEARGAGTATFLPLETLRQEDGLPEGAPPEGDPDIRWAARIVGGPQPALLHHLLGRVGIVPHLDVAEALWRRNGVVATYVTPAGEVLTPTGRLTGGRREAEAGQGNHSILRRKRAIRQLGEEAAALDLTVAAEEGRLVGLESESATLGGRLGTLESSVQTRARARLAEDKDLEAATREEERLARHLETLGVERAALATDQTDVAAALDTLAAAFAQLRTQEAELGAEAARLRGAWEEAQGAEAAAAAELTAGRVQVAALRERAEALAQDLGRLGQLEAEARERIEQGAARGAQVEDRRRELGRERDLADAQAREASLERDRLEALVRAQVEELERLQAGLRAVLDDLRALETERQQAAERLRASEIAAAEGRVRAEELLAEAERSHGLGTREALLGAADPACDLAAARSRHGELGARLEAMGPVNLVADEEYRELDERLTFLRTQHDDLSASVKDLDRALRGMTRTAQERFQEAFEAINRHFGEIFARLFEGGRAELRMVEPEEGDEDPLEQGVELMAQPRGKRLQAVSLMSGGEKALTGLALLFAIFYYRPSPFCVLDEVDAPLDDANIHRFLRVLRELQSQTQFIVITHNRKTMEAADVLYGVTMEEPGLSRLVSVRLGEV
jgi:chromosome segregation protein